MKFKINNKYILVILTSLLTSCLEQTNLQTGKATQDIQETQINITFSAKPESVITKYVNETQINNINLFVFGVSGNLLTKKYVTASSSTISTSTGNKTIVAIANAGQADFSGISTLNDLTNSICTDYKDGANNMLMVGYITQNLQKGENINIELSRIAAKISIAFDKSSYGIGRGLG